MLIEPTVIDRVSQANINSDFMLDLQRSQADVFLQNKRISSAQRVSLPEDDPGAMADAAQRSFEKQVVRQYSESAQEAKQRNTEAFNAIRKLNDASDRVSEILSLNGRLTDKTQLKAFAKELNGLVDIGVQLVNSKYLGNSLFAGARLDTAALATVVVNGEVQSVTYQGEGEAGAVQVSQATEIQPLLASAECEKLKNFIDNVIALRDAFQQEPAPDYDRMDALRPALISNSDQLVQLMGDLAAKEGRLNYAQQSNEDYYMSMDEVITELIETNPVDASIKLNSAMNALETGMAGGNAIIQMMKRLASFLTLG